MDSVGIMWEYDTAFLKGRENMASHPLDRKGLQIQEMEGDDKNKRGIWWIEWEVESANLKGLQALKVWEYIYRAVHLLEQLDFKHPESGKYTSKQAAQGRVQWRDL